MTCILLPRRGTWYLEFMLGNLIYIAIQHPLTFSLVRVYLFGFWVRLCPAYCLPLPRELVRGSYGSPTLVSLIPLYE